MARPSILETMMRVESGGRNIGQSLGTRDVNNNWGRGGGHPAQGYLQIIDPTWASHGGLATGYKSAIDAPWEVQRNVAMNIPIGQWGPNTKAALHNLGYNFTGRETLGDVLKVYGEDPNATTPGHLANVRPQQGPMKSGETLDKVASPYVIQPTGTGTEEKPKEKSFAQKAQDAIGGLGTAVGAGAKQTQPQQFAAPQFMQTGGQIMPMVTESPMDSTRRDMLARLMQSYGIA